MNILEQRPEFNCSVGEAIAVICLGLAGVGCSLDAVDPSVELHDFLLKWAWALEPWVISLEDP